MQTRDAYLLAHFVGHVCASWLCKKPTAAPTLVWSCYIKCDIYNNSIRFNLLFVVHSSCACIYLVVSSGKNKYDHNSRFWGSCIHSIIYARLLADRRINRPSCQKEIIGSSRSAHTQALPHWKSFGKSSQSATHKTRTETNKPKGSPDEQFFWKMHRSNQEQAWLCIDAKVSGCPWTKQKVIKSDKI